MDRDRVQHEGEAKRVLRAAQYVRMSTEHQKYSTENQAEAIAAYAARRGFEVVRTYEDSGKSGLRMDGRAGLQKLIADVRNSLTDFEAILVYDVSRWGRFQDSDESAYYEFTCREAGLAVHYCAEQFENDGSLSATVIKSMKRAMAGEYSRELSAKVFAGQCRLITLGYRQGGPAGYGLRRQLVDEHGKPKAILSRGEQKSLQTDRVILTPGPPEEVEVVRRLYRLFVLQQRSETEIAAQLNAEGLVTDQSQPWTRATVHQVLTNEKYIGNNIFNRSSFKLKAKRVTNTPDMWVRKDGAFEGIVDPDFFDAAQRIIQARCARFTDDELLAKLSHLLERKGALSGVVIDEFEDMPSSSIYRHRFGSLLQAYQLIGYTINEVAAKVDFSPEYVGAICYLLENGEEKLISAVERGIIPHTVAMEIARAKDSDVQRALAQAYEEKAIPGNQVLAIRQIIEQRNNSGKGVNSKRHFGRNQKPISTDTLIRSLQRETERQRSLVRRASLTRSRLMPLPTTSVSIDWPPFRNTT